MKICIIHSLYKPYTRGGAEIVVEKIIEGLLALHHSVVLITLGRKNETEFHGNLTIYRIKPFNIFSFIDIARSWFIQRILWHSLDMFNISSYLMVKKILQEENVDVAFTHNLKGIGYLIPRLLKKMRIKHIHTLHDLQLIRPSAILLWRQEKPFLVLDKIYEKICRYLFGSPEIVISPSQWLMQFYKVRGFFYHSKKIIYPNPISFSSALTPERKKYQDGRSIVSFLYLGGLETIKGILFLLKVFKNLKEKNWQLRIVGTGSKEEEIKKIIKGDSRFLYYGYIKHSALSNIFHLSDYIVVPSLCYENSPTVIYESLSYGVPVIASDIGGIPEIVKDQYNGFTFAPGDEKNLEKVIHFFLARPNIVQQYTENARISVQNFTIKNYIQKLLSLF